MYCEMQYCVPKCKIQLMLSVLLLKESIHLGCYALIVVLDVVGRMYLGAAFMYSVGLMITFPEVVTSHNEDVQLL